MPDTFSVADVAERYGVSARTVVSWIRGNELSAVDCSRKTGSKKKRWRVTEAAIAAFEALRSPASPKARRRRGRQAPYVLQFYT
jgi:uncharacterized protein YjcR